MAKNATEINHCSNLIPRIYYNLYTSVSTKILEQRSIHVFFCQTKKVYSIAVELGVALSRKNVAQICSRIGWAHLPSVRSPLCKNFFLGAVVVEWEHNVVSVSFCATLRALDPWKKVTFSRFLLVYNDFLHCRPGDSSCRAAVVDFSVPTTDLTPMEKLFDSFSLQRAICPLTCLLQRISISMTKD